MLARKSDALKQGTPPRSWWWPGAMLVMVLLGGTLVFLKLTRETNDRPPVRPPAAVVPRS